MPDFIPGLELSRSFYFEAVKPILDDKFPELKHAAGLIGPGSEVLGFDTEMSSDHSWGPRAILLLREEDQEMRPAIDDALRKNLPESFRSYSTNCGEPDPNDNGTWSLEPAEGDVNHAVQIDTLRRYLIDHLGFDIDGGIDAIDWLTFPEQKLRTLSPSNLFHDEIGVRESLDRFAWYPNDVWLYLLAAGWNRIGQEEHLMGRSGLAGDEVGSAILAARLVRDLMRLCFLMERRYAPYPKWFGTGFAHLNCAEKLIPIFSEVLSSRSWTEREAHLVSAYEIVAGMHDRLGVTDPIGADVGDFFGRPFKVVHLHGKFSEKIAERIGDATLKSLARRGPLGGIDQISDNTDLLSDPAYRVALKGLYLLP
jgi:hypothetical protein